jgi:ABC-type siderophore export system fused ATPase/permease subunit
VVVVTHDDRYFHCCDRVIRLDLGTIVAAAPPPPAPEAPR